MHTMDNLKKLPKLSKGAEKATSAFWTYNEAVMADGAVPQKYKELIAIAVALTTQCAYCLELHKKAAYEAGANEKEIAETVHVAAALRAGAAVTHGTHLFNE
ncbi:carboxymuconolactone decarboxylase family protein [Kiloniella sp.]|uniref:carboxymuconolactone decarboxylase family protein n=1 Tax=Kiloniella sp. TaxID=1938587 RepID=UPI003A952544